MDCQGKPKRPTRKERFGLDRNEASRANQVEHANKKAALDRAIREYLNISIHDPTITGSYGRFQALPKQERSKINARAHEIFGDLQAPLLIELRQHKKDQNKQIHERLKEYDQSAIEAGFGHKRRSKVFPTKAEYELYLHSDEWEMTRQRIRERTGGNCELCDNPGSRVHHLLYTQPGTELDAHLIFVCLKCHQKIHHTYKVRNVGDQKGKPPN